MKKPKNPFPNVPGGPRPMQPAAQYPVTSPQQQQAMMQAMPTVGSAAPPATPVPGYARGGYVAPNAGPPGRDTVPAVLNNGEFVLRAPAVKAAGVTNLRQLNQAAPTQKAAMRGALHHALTRQLTGR
jgi:hypothetical protein